MLLRGVHRDPVEQIGDERDGRVVERKAGPEPLHPGHHGQLAAGEPQLAGRAAAGLDDAEGGNERRIEDRDAGRCSTANCPSSRARGPWRSHRRRLGSKSGFGGPLLEQPPLGPGQPGRHHGVPPRRKRSPACLSGWQATASATGAADANCDVPGDLTAGCAAGEVHRDRGAQRGVPGREQQVDVEVPAGEPVPGVRGDPHDEVQVAAGSPVAALAALAPRPIRCPSVTQRARRPPGCAGCPAGQRHRAAGAVVGLFPMAEFSSSASW